jgi:hypothetical protein
MGTKQNILHTLLDGRGDRMEGHGQQIYFTGLQLENYVGVKNTMAKVAYL